MLTARPARNGNTKVTFKRRLVVTFVHLRVL
uniref:Uncharacterized protein n=1 Tax=Arundo donax TaxID=35708 RepID=A0A0A8ZC16_ARUDO